MKVSVIIPTYNAAAFIRTTLDSVFRQTVQPYEILILDDGSIDNTISILESYRPRISIFQRKNKGVACARNTLCQLAQGDIVAFLDHDDIWHPTYLESQCRLFEEYPQAVAYFTGHTNFYGYSNYEWKNNLMETLNGVKLLEPLTFFKQYNQRTGMFASMSYCCVSKKVLNQIGNEPFCISGVDDSYFCNVLSLLGPVVYASPPLVAYRVTENSQSFNKLKDFGLWIQVFKILEKRFSEVSDKKLYKAFAIAFASRRRQYAKRLMGVGYTCTARKQLQSSLKNSLNVISIIKSLILLVLTYVPKSMQPKWPQKYRLM